MSQRTTKPTIRHVRLAKTQISLRIRAVWSESSLMACAFYSPLAIQRGVNENPWHTGWMYRLIGIFAGRTSLIVGFVVRWLLYIFDCLQWYYIQYNLNGSNTDGSFTVDDSNSFFSPYKILPIAQENKYLGIFFLFYHGNVCCAYLLESPHRGDSNEYTQHTFIV